MSVSQALSQWDRYGFKRDFKYISKEEQAVFDSKHSRICRERQHKWDSLVSRYKGRLPPKSDEVKRMVRKGIPSNLRAACWFKYSGAIDMQAKHPSLFTLLTYLEEYDLRLLYSKENNKILEHIETIERDLERTFPENIRFQMHKNEEPNQRLNHSSSLENIKPTTLENVNSPADQKNETTFKTLKIKSSTDDPIKLKIPSPPSKPPPKSVQHVKDSSASLPKRTKSTSSNFYATVSYPGAPVDDHSNIYIKSLRRILVAFAYYSWPHPDPSRLLRVVSGAAESGLLGSNVATHSAYFAKLDDLPKRCTYNIGYCQSLNYVAGMLLLQFSTDFSNDSIYPESWVPSKESDEWMKYAGVDLSSHEINPEIGKFFVHDKLRFERMTDFQRRAIEEKVFWVLVMIIEKFLPPEMYGNSLQGVQVEQEVLWHWLLGQKGDRFGVERVARWVDALERGENAQLAVLNASHISVSNLARSKSFMKNRSKPLGAGGTEGAMPPLSMATTQWFMTLFVNVLPIETVLRVWDCFLYQGEKILLRVALTILKIHETQILTFEDPVEAWRFIKDMPRRILDCHSFMDACFRPRHTIPFTMSAPTSPMVEVFPVEFPIEPKNSTDIKREPRQTENQESKEETPTSTPATSPKTKLRIEISSSSPRREGSNAEIDDEENTEELFPDGEEHDDDFEDDSSIGGVTPIYPYFHDGIPSSETTPEPRKKKKGKRNSGSDRVVARVKRISINTASNRRLSLGDRHDEPVVHESPQSSKTALGKIAEDATSSASGGDEIKQTSFPRVVAQVSTLRSFVVRRGVGSVSRKMIEKYRAIALKEREKM
ncbi:hypothetical protein HK098_002919 [Nowakowskiella sp. JEL0407]|nr:hypothetical protein HK098_002919 [Nowakowskiella sp. JEL0407]